MNIYVLTLILRHNTLLRRSRRIRISHYAAMIWSEVIASVSLYYATIIWWLEITAAHTYFTLRHSNLEMEVKKITRKIFLCDI